MKAKTRRCKCLHCNKLFEPDYRNRGRQRYCSKAECQRASKQARQRRWLSKPENQDYFRGPAQVQRVQQWRKEHPGYWKRHRRKPTRTLQDAWSAQAPEGKELRAVNGLSTLQDVCRVQVPLLVGLISKFTDCTLQDDIVHFARRLVAKGQDILEPPSSKSVKTNTAYDEKKDPASGPLAASAGAV